MLRCDKEGVPEVVQHVRWLSFIQGFEVGFFNGHTLLISCDLIPSAAFINVIGYHDDVLKEVEKIAMKLYLEGCKTLKKPNGAKIAPFPDFGIRNPKSV